MKTTQKKLRNNKKFTCAHCGKNFQNAQGLSGHIRHQHSSHRDPAITVESTEKLQVNAPAPVASTAAYEHLQAAFVMLSRRDLKIDEEIARLEALKAEKERVQTELDAVNAALRLFVKRQQVASEEVRAEPAKDSLSVETEDVLPDVKGDSSQSRRNEISEENTIPEFKASDSDGQGGIARKAKPRQDGRSNGTKARGTPEFAGNKTDFVRAVVQFRGTAGATPRDIDQVFAQRRIEKSKNAIYNALDSLVRQNKLKKKDGQYFYVEGPGK